MQQENIWDAAAAQRYDTPGASMFAPEIVGPAVDRLAELTAESPSHVSVYRIPGDARP